MNTSTGPSNLCLRMLAQIKKNPAELAILIDGDSHHINFEQLGRHISSVQNTIAASRPVTIGIFSTPAADLIAAAWAALFEGIPYVPISPTYPEGRIRHMVQDAGVDLLLAPSHLVENIRDMVADLGIAVAAVPEHTDSGRTLSEPTVRASATAGAYILYTSGSTGVPKGVEVPHSALDNQMWWTDRELALRDRARIVHKTPISFDAAQWEFLANANGAAVVVAGADAYRNPASLIETVRRQAATHLQVVPTLLQALCEEPDFELCSSLRVLASGGEALPQRLANRTAEVLPTADLLNLYGPTEATINASYHRVLTDSTTLSPSDTVSIGVPVDGVDFHILDTVGELSDSRTGELAISGKQLASGYRNLPVETESRFITRHVDGIPTRLYRTGDLVERIDGSYFFRGRTDSQVKIRGHRIELDEVRTVLENHDWVRHAGVVAVDAGDRGARLVAHVELNPREAALMDQGVHGSHHQSKASRVQVRAQIAGLGVRDDHSEPGMPLPVSAHLERALRELAFARKSYRNFTEEPPQHEDLVSLIGLVRRPREWQRVDSVADDGNAFQSLGPALRSLVSYDSGDRLLPKYSYASPGALYGVQVYLRVSGISGIESGLYYLNPRTAHLHRVVSAEDRPDASPNASLLLIGQRSVISSVYKTNVDEVLLFEAGHLLGVLDTVLPAVGRRIGARRNVVEVAAEIVDPASSDRIVIGEWDLRPSTEGAAYALSSVNIHVEALESSGEGRGLYKEQENSLVLVGDERIVRRKDVIAINQRVYDRASFGLILTSDGTPNSYVDLGRALSRAQLNEFEFGLMSSGYSSFTGRDLPSALRIHGFLEDGRVSSYFALGGKITPGQIAHTGMDEDAVHSKGPAEIIETDVATTLPHYMVPEVIRITDRIPRTPNGKIDLQALRDQELAAIADHEPEPYVAPASLLEHRLAQVWTSTLKHDGPISTAAGFFTLGGTSITAFQLARKIELDLGLELKVQSIFEFDTIAKQARALRSAELSAASRVVPLAEASGDPVFVWPGLGGYPMNLRALAQSLPRDDFRLYGVQAHGLNEGEDVDASIVSMALRDIEEIRRVQPNGPFTLVGYSFGARVAFEAAFQLESIGQEVKNVVLLAPGSPTLTLEEMRPHAAGPYRDPRFTRILYSVFFGRTNGGHADGVLAQAVDRSSFLDAIHSESVVDRRLAERIAELVERTSSFEYTFEELRERSLQARLTIIRATGDDYSFIDALAAELEHDRDSLDADHYEILRQPHVARTAQAINDSLRPSSEHSQETQCRTSA
ncbi:non-ribosomal peptide synthetase [Leifsonia shinshuensis]